MLMYIIILKLYASLKIYLRLNATNNLTMCHICFKINIDQTTRVEIMTWCNYGYVYNVYNLEHYGIVAYIVFHMMHIGLKTGNKY